jgi:hypothetical protein
MCRAQPTLNASGRTVGLEEECPMALADSQTGTPVTLVVSPGQTSPGTHSSPPAHHPLPYTGFDLVPALALSALLVAVGTFLTATARRVSVRTSN